MSILLLPRRARLLLPRSAIIRIPLGMSFKSSALIATANRVKSNGPLLSEMKDLVKIDFATLPELQREACKAYKDRFCFGTRSGQAFEWTTYSEFASDVENFRKVLAKFGISRGDKVALISNNRVEWAVVVYAVTGIGAQLVPMYESQLESDWRYIIEDSDSKLVIAATEKVYDIVKNYPSSLVGAVKSVICFDAATEKDYSYEYNMSAVRADPAVPIDTNVSPHDLAVLIYTSGTTGQPKGVELSHNNIVSNILALKVKAMIVRKYNLFTNKMRIL